jgi:hypothetical protein
VLTTAATLGRLEAGGLLAATLFGLQTELRDRSAVGLRVGAGTGAGLSALAVRASALPHLHGGALPEAEAVVEAGPDAGGDAPLSEPGTRTAAALIGAAALTAGIPLPPTSQASFFEHLHIEERRTTFPLSGEGPHRELDTLTIRETEVA